MIRIMLIEDEEIIRKGLKNLIENVITGYQICYEATDGADALQNLEHINPDLIITDIRMDRMNGIETIRFIYEHKPDLPIIVISGYDDFIFVRSALKCGVADYLLKPVDRIELKEALEKAVPDKCNKLKTSMETEDDNNIIRQVKSIINQRLHQEISLRIVASQVHINHQYLSVLFKNEIGISFSKYVASMRMEKAKRLLRETNLKVYEISGMCGYMSTKQFTGVFKRFTGKTPSEYKNI